MDAGNLTPDLSIIYGIFATHLDAGYSLVADVVKIELYPSALLEVQYFERYLLCPFLSEIHVADHNPVPVVNRSHIVAAACAAVNLHAVRAGHSLGLHSLARVESRNGCGAFLCEGDERDAAVRIEGELLHTG